MFENTDFGKGVSRKYIDFDINKDISLVDQIDLLKEDLLQVNYDNNYLIDIGWYPEFHEEGSFRVSVIKEYQWDTPILQKCCRDLGVLDELINECINITQCENIKDV